VLWWGAILAVYWLRSMFADSSSSLTKVMDAVVVLVVASGATAIAMRYGRRLRSRTRRKFRVGYYLLLALALWSLCGVGQNAVSWWAGYSAFYAPPPWSEIPAVAAQKLPEMATWLGPGLVYGVPLAVVWQQRKQPGRRPLRWTEWAGLLLTGAAFAGAMVDSLITIIGHGHVWWTELIWQLPAAILVVAGSWLGASRWQRRGVRRAR
jgi:hypothetical protein